MLLKSPRSFLILTFISLVNALAFWQLHTMSGNTQVYLRNLLFSEIVSDAEASDEEHLNARLRAHFHTDGSVPLDSYINETKLASLRQLKQSGIYTDEMAKAISAAIGPSPDGTYCGKHPLYALVRGVEHGQGCCSDYSKAFLVYSRHLGIQVREVYVLSHATVEYFNPEQDRWIWFDPYFNTQITDRSGRVLSLYQIRMASRFQELNLLDHPPNTSSIPAFVGFRGYDTRHYDVLLYKKGNNFFELEQLHRRLRWLHLPKPVLQFGLFVLGVQPGYLMLTTEGMAVYMHALQNVLWGIALFWASINAISLGLLIYVERRWRSHARTSTSST